MKELEAVCIQHEIDHLDGINFVDYLSPLKRKILLRELQKNLAEQGVAA
jgi:peptide deformylase